MPIVSIDWSKIRGLYSGGTALVALTDEQIAILNSLCAQLHWRKTWRVDGFDFDTDWDTVEAEVDDLIANLNMPVFLTDLLTALSDIKNAIDAIEAVQDYCCAETDPTGGAQYVDPFTEGATNEVPQQLVDAGLASTTDDWAGFYAYQCAIAHIFVENLKSKLEDFDTLFDAGGLLIVGVGAIATLATVISGGSALLLTGIIVGTAGAASLFSNINSLGQAGLPNPEDVEDIRTQLTCAWTDSAHDGFAARHAAWIQALYDNLPDAQAAMLASLSMESTMRPLYGAQHDTRNLAQELVDQGFDPANYSCPCIPPSSCDANNQLVDCGFESGALGNGWEQNDPANNAQFETANPYEGTYRMNPGGAGQGNYGYYIYQNFTATASGTLRLQARQLYRTGLYNNAARLYQGGAQVGSEYSMATTHDAIWNHYNQLTNWSVTQGVTYQLRIYWSYQYVDNVKLSIE